MKCQRTASITTRIKTVLIYIIYPIMPRQRTASITTRIKTRPIYIYPQSFGNVREQHPLQQGLRLYELGLKSSISI